MTIAILPLLVAGCAGHASIHVIPLSLSKINTTTPMARQITPNECYYWLNDANELCIAMKKARPSLFGGRFSRKFLLSMVLEGAPAGSARNYRAGRRTVRSRHKIGLSHTRSASLAGVATVWDYGKERLRGRFRVWAKQQSFSALSGWGSGRKVLIAGEFSARQDQRAGEKILLQTEEDAMKRPSAKSERKRAKAASRKTK